MESYRTSISPFKKGDYLVRLFRVGNKKLRLGISAGKYSWVSVGKRRPGKSVPNSDELSTDTN